MSEQLAALEDLLTLRVPLADALAHCGPGHDRDEVVQLTAAHVVSVLERFAAGRLTAAEVEAWADAVHLRDDVGRPEALTQPLLELANPVLFGPLSETVPGLLARLRG